MIEPVVVLAGSFQGEAVTTARRCVGACLTSAGARWSFGLDLATSFIGTAGFRLGDVVRTESNEDERGMK